MGGEREKRDGWGTLIGQVVNGHEIRRLLGAGGMGEVYLARHQFLGAYRALKVIHDDFRQSSEAQKRFHREAVALGRLHHPNIVNVIDFGCLANHWPFMLMEYLEGPTIDDHIMRHGAMPVADGLQTLLQLARALSYAHFQGIVHRDLKPANSIYHQGQINQVKVIDFGLVRLASEEMRTKLTRAQQVMGSPDYMAPEQAQGRLDISPATDIYALGGIAHRIVTGHTPFGERPLLSLIAAHSSERAPRLADRCPMPIPPALDELVDACLEKDPAARPTSNEVAAELVSLLSMLGEEPAAHGDDESKRTQALGTLDQAEASPPIENHPPKAADAAGPAPARQAGVHAIAVADSEVPAKPAPADELRGATKVAPAPAPAPHPARAAAVSLRQLLDDAEDRDPTSVRGPLANQIGAVLREIGEKLSIGGDIDSIQNEAERLRDEITEIEMEIALLDADLETGASGDVVARRRSADDKRRALMGDLRAHELALIEHVERARPSADASLRSLFSELDELVDRLRTSASA